MRYVDMRQVVVGHMNVHDGHVDVALGHVKVVAGGNRAEGGGEEEEHEAACRERGRRARPHGAKLGHLGRAAFFGRCPQAFEEEADGAEREAKEKKEKK